MRDSGRCIWGKGGWEGCHFEKIDVDTVLRTQ